MRAGIITLVLLCLPAAAATASDNVRADNPHITFEGRTVRKSGNVTFDWSNTTVRINFTGTTLDMECSTTGDSYFNVWVDSRPGAKEQKVVHTHGDCRIVLAEGLESGFHSVILQKRSEGEHGCVTIKTFSTDGRIETSSSPFKHHIEFIGDSYTCGYGTESSDRNQPFRTEEENCNLAYASIIGRYFDAGVRTISHSGRGVERN